MAGSAEEALILLKNHRPAVALLDIVLPGMNGLDLLQRLRKISGDTEVLVITSHSSAETALKAVRLGAFDYLEKPFDDLNDVWVKVQRALEKRSLSKKHREVLTQQQRKSQEISSAVSRVEPRPMDQEADAGAHPCADLIEDFVELAVNELEVARLSLYLLDEESDEFTLAASRGFELSGRTEVGLRPGQGIPGAVLQTGEPFLFSRKDVASMSARKDGVDPSHPILSTPIDLSVPLKTETRVLGTVNLGRKRASRGFTSDDLGFLAGLAGQLAVAIEATTQSHRLQRAYETLESTQAQLVASERTKAFSQMAAGVAHDFNNALGVILARAELGIYSLDGSGAGLDGLRKDLEIIKSTALQSAEMVKRVQDYSRIRKDIPETPVDLNAIVRDAVEISRPKWKDVSKSEHRGVEVDFDLSEIPIVRGNAYELTQVVNNLIFNAVEAMPEGGSVTFRSRTDGKDVVLEVADTGTGMDEGTRRRLFDPFFTTKPYGQGLGMSVVFGIVARHQGRIEVRSAPDMGTTFRIALPMPESPLEEPAPVARGSGNALQSLRILLVDDDELVLETYKATLSASGHQVLGAPSGSAALSMLRDEAFDVLITDLSMSGMTGFELAKEAKELHPRLPVILLTGWIGQENDDKLSASGVDGILAKPCLLEDMLDAIREAVQRPANVSTGHQA